MSRWFVSSILLMTASVVGCSGGTDFGPMGSVSGMLTLDGQPVAEGTQLLFKQMQAGYAAFGQTDALGNYTITWIRDGERKSELPVGEYHVLIQPPESGTDTEEMSADELLEGGDVAPAEPEFPRMYQQHTTSGLKFTISEGENNIDINMESNPT